MTLWNSYDDILVTKRDGSLEKFDIDKIHQVLHWATEGITGVSVSEIELRMKVQLYNKIPTKVLHEALIKSAADLISEETPNYQWVASRLVNMALRKEVYGNFEPPSLYDIVKTNIERGVYTSELLEKFTKQDFDILDVIVDHKRDFLLSYAAIEQFRGKYLVKNRATGEFYETPQVAYILIAALLFSNYKENRMKYIKEYYDAISKGPKSLLSIPTPILAGVRTPTKQFSSCVLVSCGDSLESINEVASCIVDYASRRAGLGINGGRIRAIGSEVRNGEVRHTGIIPFWRYFQAALQATSQGGVRSASATVCYPIWHYEVEDLIVLKNNKGTEESRLRHLDYSVQINGYLYKRFLNKEKITLFSPHDVPDLYHAFFTDQKKFAELYEKYERARSIRKKEIDAVELFTLLVVERNNTGRIYIHNVDHGNEHGAFDLEKVWVEQSNLCQEIELPSYPLTREGRLPFDKTTLDNYKEISSEEFREKYGEIALCTLSAINWGQISEPEDFELPCRLAVRALDELLDYQDYPMIASGVPGLFRRALGIGINNLGYFLAKRDLKYSDHSANETIHEYMEAMMYYLIKASVDLAKEKGKCHWFEDTKYSKGILPIDTYNKNVDKIVKNKLNYDWESLRKEILKHGMRNSTLCAVAPTESSSMMLATSCNGIEPPRTPVAVKQSKDGVLKQPVPEIQRLKNKYEYLWDMKSMEGYLEIAAIIQKFADQTISTNTSYNPKHFPEEKITLTKLMKDILYAYKLGIHTLYYQNTYDGSGEDLKENEQECETCKL